MQIRKSSGCLALAVTILGALALLIGWAEFFFKPLQLKTKNSDMTGWEIFFDLLKLTPDAYGWPFAGYLFLLATALIALVVILSAFKTVTAAMQYIEISEAPISVLHSKITFKILDDEFARCEITREQYVHANQKNVDAYHICFRASKGTVDPKKLAITSRLNGKKITKDLLVIQRNSELDVIERFSSSIPTSKVLTYLPDAAVYFLYNQLKLFKNTIVIRTSVTEDLNEYDGEFPNYVITASRYPASNIEIEFDFPSVTAPSQEDMFAYLIANQAVTDLHLIPIGAVGDRAKYTVSVEKLRQEQKLRVQWNNKKLFAYKSGKSKPVASGKRTTNPKPKIAGTVKPSTPSKRQVSAKPKRQPKQTS